MDSIKGQHQGTKGLRANIRGPRDNPKGQHTKGQYIKGQHQKAPTMDDITLRSYLFTLLTRMNCCYV